MNRIRRCLPSRWRAAPGERRALPPVAFCRLVAAAVLLPGFTATLAAAPKGKSSTPKKTAPAPAEKPATPPEAPAKTVSLAVNRDGSTTLSLPGRRAAGEQIKILKAPEHGKLGNVFSTGSPDTPWGVSYQPAAGDTAKEDRFTFTTTTGGNGKGKTGPVTEVILSFPEPHLLLHWSYESTAPTVPAGTMGQGVLKIINPGDAEYPLTLSQPPPPWSTASRKVLIPARGEAFVNLIFAPAESRVYSGIWIPDADCPEAAVILSGVSSGKAAAPPTPIAGSGGGSLPSVRNGSSKARPTGKATLSANPTLLYIGDSLSVGDFGDELQKVFLKGIGASRLVMVASGGSSVHSWMSEFPAYVTRCGYRETRTGVNILDPKSGPTYSTPKIETMLNGFKPEILAIQLGTNHFDAIQEGGTKCLPAQKKLFESFADTIVKNGTSLKLVIWITPPDSSRFSPEIQTAVWDIIQDVCRTHKFEIIDSRKYTRYVMGKSGSDGVHYGGEDCVKWAACVLANINAIVTRTGWRR